MRALRAVARNRGRAHLIEEWSDSVRFNLLFPVSPVSGRGKRSLCVASSGSSRPDLNTLTSSWSDPGGKKGDHRATAPVGDGLGILCPTIQQPCYSAKSVVQRPRQSWSKPWKPRSASASVLPEPRGNPAPSWPGRGKAPSASLHSPRGGVSPLMGRTKKARPPGIAPPWVKPSPLHSKVKILPKGSPSSSRAPVARIISRTGPGDKSRHQAPSGVSKPWRQPAGQASTASRRAVVSAGLLKAAARGAVAGRALDAMVSASKPKAKAPAALLLAE